MKMNPTLSALALTAAFPPAHARSADHATPAGSQTTPTEDKQRMETLKGANAVMFGVASPAGIINLVTKRALNVDTTSFMTSGNSFGQIGFAADIGRPTRRCSRAT